MEKENMTQAEERTKAQDEVKQQDDQPALPETQAELDRQISKAVETALANRQVKFDQELEAAVQEAVKEERSYAKMSQAEKQEADWNKREKDLAAREAALKHKELLAEVKADLHEKGLPLELADLLAHGDDKDTILASVNVVRSLVDEAVQNGVKAALRQESPSVSNRGVQTTDPELSLAAFAAKNRMIK